MAKLTRVYTQDARGFSKVPSIYYVSTGPGGWFRKWQVLLTSVKLGEKELFGDWSSQNCSLTPDCSLFKVEKI